MASLIYSVFSDEPAAMLRETPTSVDKPDNFPYKEIPNLFDSVAELNKTICRIEENLLNNKFKEALAETDKLQTSFDEFSKDLDYPLIKRKKVIVKAIESVDKIIPKLRLLIARCLPDESLAGLKEIRAKTDEARVILDQDYTPPKKTDSENKADVADSLLKKQKSESLKKEINIDLILNSVSRDITECYDLLKKKNFDIIEKKTKNLIRDSELLVEYFSAHSKSNNETKLILSKRLNVLAIIVDDYAMESNPVKFRLFLDKFRDLYYSLNTEIPAFVR